MAICIKSNKFVVFLFFFKERSEQEDTGELKAKLQRLERENAELTQKLELQKEHTKQLLLGPGTKVGGTNVPYDVIVQQARERDQQLSEISSDLMYFESCILRTREKSKIALAEKIKQIKELKRTVKHQEKQINALNRANENLISSLHDLKDNYDEQKKRDSLSRYNSDDHMCGEQPPTFSSISPCGTRGVSSRVAPVVRCGVHCTNGVEYQNGDHTDRTVNNNNHKHVQNGINQQNDKFLTVPSLSQVNSNNRRTRKLSDINHRSPSTLYNMNTNTIALPRSPQQSHRLRFTPDVKKIREEEEDEGERKETLEIVKPVLKLRKISLPAYRLPITDDDNEEFI